MPQVKKLCQDQEGIEYKELLLIDNTPAPSAKKLTSQDGKTTTVSASQYNFLKPSNNGIKMTTVPYYSGGTAITTSPRRNEGIDFQRHIYWILHVWEDISPITIKKFWKKLIPSSDAFVPLWIFSKNWDILKMMKAGRITRLAENSTTASYQLMADSEIVAEDTEDRENSDPPPPPPPRVR